MIELKLAQKNREDTEALDNLYANLVETAIRQRYSVSAELAILRQRDAKPEEFAEYNAYCERCKREVKDALGIPASATSREVKKVLGIEVM